MLLYVTLILILLHFTVSSEGWRGSALTGRYASILNFILTTALRMPDTAWLWQ